VCPCHWELNESGCILPPSLHVLLSHSQGTWKGGAKAIKLASLTRLSQTKSVDGKSTVMDYLVQVLTTRSQNGDVGSTNALSLDEELKGIHQAKNISMTGPGSSVPFPL
jgi:hypothetical protein